MAKSPDAFRSIGEVSRLVGVAPHVLRYWESQFAQLAPVKRADGRRYYRPDDVRLVAGLCQVLREEGLSIRGAKRLIGDDRGAALRQIGAVRLGDGAAQGDVVTQPVMRLALPDGSPLPPPVTRGKAAVPSGGNATSPAVKPRRAGKKSADGPQDGLPLFPQDIKAAPKGTYTVQDGVQPWLGRLVALTAALRAHERAACALPDGAHELAQSLRQSR